MASVVMGPPVRVTGHRQRELNGKERHRRQAQQQAAHRGRLLLRHQDGRGRLRPGPVTSVSMAPTDTASPDSASCRVQVQRHDRQDQR